VSPAAVWWPAVLWHHNRATIVFRLRTPQNPAVMHWARRLTHNARLLPPRVVASRSAPAG